MNRYLSLALFVLLVLGGGTAIGLATGPGEWYAALEKPWFNPPGWVFGPVWSVLYVLIAIAGWRVWRKEGFGGAMALWIAQLVLNFIWSPTFFGLHAIAAALAVILLMLAAIIAFIAVAWRRDRAAALFFVPYLLWVGFAALLNGSILALNS